MFDLVKLRARCLTVELYSVWAGNLTASVDLSTEPRSGVSVMSKNEMPSWMVVSSSRYKMDTRVHTLLSAHFSASVTHLVSPGASSIRYCSGDMKPCTCWAAFWAILGTLNACTARPEAQAARIDDVFMVDGSD